MRLRVHEPGERNPVTGIQWHLLFPVTAFRSRREDLADPIRDHLEPVSLRERRQAYLKPAGNVGHHHLDIQDKVNLRLVDDPPAAGATTPAAIWAFPMALAGL